MAFWNRKPITPQRHPASATLIKWDATVASAQQFDLNNPKDVERLVKLQQQWQTDAWLYLRRVGELKDAYRFVENSFRRLRVYAAFQRSADEEPIPVGDAIEPPDSADGDMPEEDLLPVEVAELADGIMRDFTARDGGQGSLMARFGVNIFMVGEALVIQRAIPIRRPMEGEDPATIEQVWDWEVRSIREVRKSNSGKGVETVDSPDQQEGTPVVGIGDADPFVERIYRRDGEWSNWADSNVASAIDILEEIRLLGLVARASLRSRAMAGVWRLPEELDFGGTDLPGGAPGPTTQGITFERAMAEAFAAAIGNEADPNSVAPILVRGKAEFLNEDVFGPVEMPRRYGEDERSQYEEAIKKLARTIELPMEALLGLESVNHWTAFVIDEQKYQAYIQPLAEVVNEGLTYGLLHPRLRDAGVDEKWVQRIVVDDDASALIRRADEGKIAGELHAADAISDESLRRHNGFGDDDAPSDEELLRRWLLRSNASPDLAPMLLKLTELVEGDETPMLALAPGSGNGNKPDDEPDPLDPDKGPPSEGDREPAPPPEAVTAALAAERDVGRALASIDMVLSERLLTACDQAVARVLERVGGRIRSKPRSSQPAELRSALTAAKDVPNSLLVCHLDASLVAAAVGPDAVTEDDFADLHDRYEAWVLAAQDGSLRELTALASDTVTDGMLARARDQQTQDRNDGWLALLAALLGYTLGVIAGAEDDFDMDGEWDPTVNVNPTVVRESLAVAGGSQVERGPLGGVFAPGGGPLTGVATGLTIQGAFSDAGYVFTEWIWEYGSAPRQRPYEPHLALDGAPSSVWGSFAPGDHKFCRCGMFAVVQATATVEVAA